MRKSWLIGVIAAQLAFPALAQTPDAATQDNAHAIAAKMLPQGIYAKMMATVLPNIIKQMSAAMPGLMLREMLKNNGLPSERVNQLSPSLVNEMLAIFDPAMEERSRIVNEESMRGVTAIMSEQEPALREAYVQAFINRFTPEQLADVRRFGDTPSGNAFFGSITLLGSNPAIQAQVKTLMTAMIQKMPAIMDEARAKTSGLPKTRQYKDLTPQQKARLKELVGAPTH